MKYALLGIALALATIAFALDGQIGIHDPSTVVQCNGKFYTYGTGGSSLVSDDGWTWRRGTALPRRGLAPDVAIGSNAASVWWVNGKEVIGIYGDRQTVIDDGVSKRLTLNQGPNIVRAAVVNGGGATDFCARFLDADDKPLKAFTVSLSQVRKP